MTSRLWKNFGTLSLSVVSCNILDAKLFIDNKIACIKGDDRAEACLRTLAKLVGESSICFDAVLFDDDFYDCSFTRWHWWKVNKNSAHISFETQSCAIDASDCENQEEWNDVHCWRIEIRCLKYFDCWYSMELVIYRWHPFLFEKLIVNLLPSGSIMRLTALIWRVKVLIIQIYFIKTIGIPIFYWIRSEVVAAELSEYFSK